MADESMRKILCEHCQTEMEEDEVLPRKSLELYSGSSNITDSSVATSVTTYPYSDFSASTSGRAGFQKGDLNKQATPLRIRNYTCPYCKWKTQKIL